MRLISDTSSHVLKYDFHLVTLLISEAATGGIL